MDDFFASLCQLVLLKSSSSSCSLRMLQKVQILDSYFLNFVCIDPPYQQAGYAKYFLTHTLLSWADSAGKCVETLVFDDRQVAYLHQFGFFLVERWQVRQVECIILRDVH